MKKQNKNALLIIIITNALLVCVIVFLIFLSFQNTNKASKAQNVENIRTLTAASSDKIKITFNYYTQMLNDLASYINSHSEGMTKNELQQYLANFLNLDEFNLQIVEKIKINPLIWDSTVFKATCFLEDGIEEKEYPSLRYDNLARIFASEASETLGVVKATSEFDDIFSYKKSFAFTTTIRMASNDRSEILYYTLMFVIESDRINSIISSDSLTINFKYHDYDSIIVDKRGDYVISSDFSLNNNLIEYINVYDKNHDESEEAEILRRLEDNDVAEPLYYQNNKHEDCIYTISSIDGTEWYILSVVPINSFHNMNRMNIEIFLLFAILIILFIIDVLYFMNVNKQLKLKTKESMVANAAKGNFLSRMSHEIRTPLNAVIGYNTIARNELENASNEEERRVAEMRTLDCLEKSGIASKHLLTIINDVLDISAIESGKIKIAHEKFDFKGLITSLTTIFYSQARAKGVELEVIFNDLTDEWFIGDQMRVNQILTNLLSNAIKFTHEGGFVKLKIYQPDASVNKSHIHFEISDTGIGMDKEYLNHIWLPFEQADSSISRRFGGTGLGLSITKNLIDLMGGTIEVKSTLGIGTTFDVDIVFEPVKDKNLNNIYDFSNINALIVDDDYSTCDYIKLLFDRCGAKSAAVTSGEDAIKAISLGIENNNPFTICLVDWRMPKMDGIETINNIRKIVGDELPIIVLSAYDYTEVAADAKKNGVDRFISKPLFQSTLFDMLVDISGKKMNLDKKINDKKMFNGEKVLLAEDNMMNMEIAKRLLVSGGLVVDGVWNGKEAVEKFISSEPGTYCAILMDIHMPEMNGLEATKLIRDSEHLEGKTIPIIAMTADAFSENISEAKAARMNDHISKPIDFSVLFETLKKYM